MPREMLSARVTALALLPSRYCACTSLVVVLFGMQTSRNHQHLRFVNAVMGILHSHACPHSPLHALSLIGPRGANISTSDGQMGQDAQTGHGIWGAVGAPGDLNAPQGHVRRFLVFAQGERQQRLFRQRLRDPAGLVVRLAQRQQAVQRLLMLRAQG